MEIISQTRVLMVGFHNHASNQLLFMSISTHQTEVVLMASNSSLIAVPKLTDVANSLYSAFIAAPLSAMSQVTM